MIHYWECVSHRALGSSRPIAGTTVSICNIGQATPHLKLLKHRGGSRM